MSWMQRETAVKWYIFLGLVLWFFGTGLALAFDAGSFLSVFGGLVRTVGLAVFLTVIVGGVWQTVRRD